MNPGSVARSRLRARAAGAAAATALLTAAAFTGAPAAAADDQFLQLSLDGSNFGSTAAGTVFDSALRYIPGGSSDGTLWVRNAGRERAHLSVAAVTTAMDPELSGALVLERAVDGVSLSGQQPLGDAGSCLDLGVREPLEPGEAVKLSFTAGLVLEAGNQTRNKQAEFDFRLLLDSAGPGGRSACSGVSPVPGNPAAMPVSQAAPGPRVDRNSAVAVVAGAPAMRPAFNGPAALPAPGVPGVLPKRIGEVTVPVPASFIESTVEPITRTLVGALLIAVTAAFAGTAYRRISTTRRTS
ncbi:hypothetical protein ACWGQ2_00600 [Arthrobacter sp. NPDC055585]